MVEGIPGHSEDNMKLKTKLAVALVAMAVIGGSALVAAQSQYHPAQGADPQAQQTTPPGRVGASKPIRYRCLCCGAWHGGLFGKFCPDCYKKNQEPICVPDVGS